jgi:hypothetical protein
MTTLGAARKPTKEEPSRHVLRPPSVIRTDLHATLHLHAPGDLNHGRGNKIAISDLMNVSIRAYNLYMT